MATARVQRGRKSQDYVAERLQKAGWVNAEGVPASLPGRDILGTPGWAIEVKGTRKNPLPAALRQAAKNAAEGETPLVVWRPDGYGEARIDEWVVAFTFKDAVELMQKAEGFGPEPEWADGQIDPHPIPCGHNPENVWFSRSICPDPCGTMHYHCEECGAVADRNGCALEVDPEGSGLLRRIEALEIEMGELRGDAA